MSTFRDWLAANTQPPTFHANGLGATLTATTLVHRRASRLIQPWETADELLALIQDDELACEALADAQQQYEAENNTP